MWSVEPFATSQLAIGDMRHSYVMLNLVVQKLLVPRKYKKVQSRLCQGHGWGGGGKGDGGARERRRTLQASASQQD